MKYAPMLGPVPCKVCKKPLVWNGWAWREPKKWGLNLPHVCEKAA